MLGQRSEPDPFLDAFAGPIAARALSTELMPGVLDGGAVLGVLPARVQFVEGDVFELGLGTDLDVASFFDTIRHLPGSATAARRGAWW